MVSSELVGHDSGYEFLTFRLHFRKKQLKQPSLTMPATDAGETSGIRNLRQRPISLEDTIYNDAGNESLNQYK